MHWLLNTYMIGEYSFKFKIMLKRFLKIICLDVKTNWSLGRPFWFWETQSLKIWCYLKVYIVLVTYVLFQRI